MTAGFDRPLMTERSLAVASISDDSQVRIEENQLLAANFATFNKIASLTTLLATKSKSGTSTQPVETTESYSRRESAFYREESFWRCHERKGCRTHE